MASRCGRPFTSLQNLFNVSIVSTLLLFIRRVGEALVSCAAREMTVFSFVCPVMDIDVVAREFEFDIMWILGGDFR